MSRYVATDWHGNYAICTQILNYLKEDDELYFLGDAIDRGPDGVPVMLSLLKDKRVTYLKGNHEDMMIESIPFLMEGRTAYWWFNNGGQETWKGLEKVSDEIKMEFCKKVSKMPERVDLTTADGKTIILSHAGCDPWVTDEWARLWGIKDRYIWDRKHIHSSPMDFKEDEWKNTYVIHGHTPVLCSEFCGDPDVTLPGHEKVKAITYADGHKICLDLCTIITKEAVLFNLDTFEEIYFTEEGIRK